MKAIDWILIILCAGICIISAATDLKYKKIKNKVIIPAILVSIVLNVISSLQCDEIIHFFINLIFVSLFGVTFYAFHYMGAGDSKLLIFIVASIPVHFYENRIRGYFGSIIILIYIFTVCMAYIIIESIILNVILRNKGAPIGKINLKNFFLSYIRGLIIITLINEIMWLLLNDFYTSNPYAIMLLNFIIATKIPEIRIFSNVGVNIALFAIDVSIAIITPYGQRFIGNDYSIILVFLLFLIVRRLVIERYNYKKIPTSQVETGMILSTETTMLMTRSKVKGLPSISTEDMRSKITQEEADSIRRWAKSKYGMSEVLIVRYLPFGLFISLGTIIFIIESMVKTLCN